MASLEGIEDRLRARGEWLGASCVPRWGTEGFLFAARVDGDALVLSGVGGKVEPGETFKAAMVREFEEETGCRLKEVCRVDAPRYLPDVAHADVAHGEPIPDGGLLAQWWHLSGAS